MNKPLTWKGRVAEFPDGFRQFSTDIKLTGAPRVDFLRSEWDAIPPKSTVVTIPYLIYRFIFAAYFVVFLVLSLVISEYPGFWMLFATNWTFLTQTIYALFTFLNVTWFWGHERWSEAHPFYHLNVNWFESVIWCFLNLSYSTPQYISITYWLFVYGAPGSSVEGSEAVGWSLTVHGINAILVIIDALVVAAPFRVTHFIYPVVANALYLLMTGLYEAFGGPYKDETRPYIYPILNWRSGQVGAVITTVTSLLCITAFHFLFWLLVVTRKHFASVHRSYPSLYDDEEEPRDGLDETKPLLESKI